MGSLFFSRNSCQPPPNYVSYHHSGDRSTPFELSRTVTVTFDKGVFLGSGEKSAKSTKATISLEPQKQQQQHQQLKLSCSQYHDHHHRQVGGGWSLLQRALLRPSVEAHLQRCPPWDQPGRGAQPRPGERGVGALDHGGAGRAPLLTHRLVRLLCHYKKSKVVTMLLHTSAQRTHTS